MTEPILVPDRPAESLELSGREPVSVTLLTGFLGSGKTTLLNWILNGDHGLRVGVLVNDFGAVNIDAALIEGVSENTVSLANGCVCCEIRDDLMLSLAQLLAENEAIDHVIIEASGIADPESVATTLVDPKYAQLVRLDTISCVVDANTFLDEDVPPEITALKIRQMGYSDLVVLNKIDLVGYEYAAAVRKVIAGFAPNLAIVEAIDAEVPLDILLAVDRYDGHKDSGPVATPSQDSSTPTFETFHYRSDTPMSLEALERMIGDLPRDIYRVKGVVLASEDPHRRAVLQAVGMRARTSLGEPWGDRPARTDIIVIGATGSLDDTSLRRAFDACAA